MAQLSKPLAIITGASTGIGYQLAKCCGQGGFDLVVVADEPGIQKAAKDFEALGVKVDALQADLAEVEGVDKLYALIGARPVEALLANAGRGLGKGFLDQDFDDVLQVINTNITGTVYLIQKVGRDMRKRGRGRILITGSIAGFVPGTYQAVYNASKAFLDSFSFALRAELTVRRCPVMHDRHCTSSRQGGCDHDKDVQGWRSRDVELGSRARQRQDRQSA
jgi:uncharacterized protein